MAHGQCGAMKMVFLPIFGHFYYEDNEDEEDGNNKYVPIDDSN